MPFVGTPVVKQISDRIVRITGISMDADTVASIGLHGVQGSPPDIILPESFRAAPYHYQGHDVDIADMVECTVALISLGVAADAPVAVGKTGFGISSFRIELASPFAAATPGLEIYIKIHD